MDAACVVATVNAIVYDYRVVLHPFSGFPIAAMALGAAIYLDLVSDSIRVTSMTDVSFSETAMLFLFVDCLQYFTHLLSHRCFYASHKLHHVHTSPTHRDAFSTGLFDATFQLMFPILAAINLIEPTRGSLVAFGTGYSVWLQFIHSDRKWCSSIWVTPQYHRVHHRHPTKNFGHIFTIWDRVFKTVQWPKA